MLLEQEMDKCNKVLQDAHVLLEQQLCTSSLDSTWQPTAWEPSSQAMSDASTQVHAL